MIGRTGKQFVQVKKFRVDNLNPYCIINQRGRMNNETITEKKIEKEVVEILERMGNNIRGI